MTLQSSPNSIGQKSAALPPAPPKQTSKVPANIIWSADQKVLIDTVKHYLVVLQEWRAEGRAQKRLPVAPTLLVVGGTGNGKTTTLSKITEMYAEYNLPLVSATMTGVLFLKISLTDSEAQLTALVCRCCCWDTPELCYSSHWVRHQGL